MACLLGNHDGVANVDRPLAAGAYALGRAKKGSELLCQKMMVTWMLAKT